MCARASVYVCGYVCRLPSQTGQFRLPPFSTMPSERGCNPTVHSPSLLVCVCTSTCRQVCVLYNGQTSYLLPGGRKKKYEEMGGPQTFSFVSCISILRRLQWHKVMWKSSLQIVEMSIYIVPYVSGYQVVSFEELLSPNNSDTAIKSTLRPPSPHRFKHFPSNGG